MTTEEALAAAVVEPVNDIFEIDPETPYNHGARDGKNLWCIT